MRAPIAGPQLTEIADTFGLSPYAAQVVAARLGTDHDHIAAFLDASLSTLADPAELPGIAGAVEALEAAVDGGATVAIYGDYDADGITGSAILHDVLASVDADVRCIIPNRSDGYGLTVAAVRTLHRGGVTMIITVDNGIAALDACATAKELGIEVVVTDHHQVGASLPDCTAAVHPALDGYDGSWRDASGAGVALALAIVLRRRFRERGRYTDGNEPHLGPALQLAAVGTVADMVPLTGANRTIVREGLQRLRATQHLGLRALIQVAGIDKDTLDEESIAFGIAPRINAAGRVGDANVALRCLVAESDTAAARLAADLDEANTARKRVEQKIADLLAEQVTHGQFADAPAIVAAHPDWNHGVLGIVAGRLSRDYARPTILFQIQGDAAKGSARGVPGFDMMEALERVRHLCTTLGGHKEAAGMTVPVGELGTFRELFCAAVHAQAERIAPEALTLDCVVPLADASLDLVTELAGLGPFGAGNPRPLFVSDACLPTGARLLKGEHLSFSLATSSGQLRAIGFRQAHHYPLPAGQVQLAYRPAIDTWRGGHQVQVMIEDLQPLGL